MTDFVDGTAFNAEQGNRARKLFAAVVLAALDDAIEVWVKATYDTPINFEIEDALGKLKRLKLCEITGTAETGEPIWAAVSLTEAGERLDFLWDNFFQMHAPQT